MTAQTKAGSGGPGRRTQFVVYCGLLGLFLSHTTNAAYWLDKFGSVRGLALLIGVSGLLIAIAAAFRYRTNSSASRLKWLVPVVMLVISGVSGGVFFAYHQPSETDNWKAAWDGKFAKDFPDCVDPPASRVLNGSEPPVIGPNGQQVGKIQLHAFAKPECPPAVWAWVLWNGDPDAEYQIPAGWVLHVVIRRDKTKTRFDAIEPARGLAVPYAISNALIANDEAGCVSVDAYFENLDGRPSTPMATTACKTAN